LGSTSAPSPSRGWKLACAEAITTYREDGQTADGAAPGPCFDGVVIDEAELRALLDRCKTLAGYDDHALGTKRWPKIPQLATRSVER
jgi:hypothetical protein